MSKKQTESIGIPSFRSELKKAHFVYDAYDRVIAVYEAMTDTENGGKCMLTRYTYIGIKTIAENLVEENSTWNSAWDI